MRDALCSIVIFSGLAVGSTALAQQQTPVVPPPGLDARLYRLPIDSEAMLWTNDAGTAPSGHWRARLGLHHMSNPVVFTGPDQEEIEVVSGVSEMNLTGGVSLAFLRMGVDVPILLRVNGAQLEGAAGIGDVALDVKAAITDREATDAPVGVAALMRLTLPTATLDAAVGTEGLGVEVEGIVDKRIGAVLLAGNLGSRFIPRAELGALEWGSYGYGRAGVGVFIVEDAGLSIDLAGHMVYGIPLSDPVGHPAEGILGGFGRLSEVLVVRGGVGTGLSGGLGAPDLRYIASVGYEPEEVRDRDEDGIRDKLDACPIQPEDVDGFADSDGCPDPTQKVTFRVRDHMSRPVFGSSLSVQAEGGIEEGGSEMSLEMHAGTYEVTGRADRYEDRVRRFTVVEGRETAVNVDLDPLFGEVRVIVKDGEGGYLSGTVEVDGERPIRIRGGLGRAEVGLGSHTVRVRADGFQDATQSVEVRSGQRSDVEFALVRAKAQLTDDKIEILEKVFFDVAKASIRSESHGLLEAVAAILLAHPEVTRVRIEGHTDRRGSAARNRQLSAARAEAVRDFLVTLGVEVERLEAVGFGPDRLLDPAGTAVADELNRRVEFVIVERQEQASSVPVVD